jgi:hypothetical protein
MAPLYIATALSTTMRIAECFHVIGGKSMITWFGDRQGYILDREDLIWEDDPIDIEKEDIQSIVNATIQITQIAQSISIPGEVSSITLMIASPVSVRPIHPWNM